MQDDDSSTVEVRKLQKISSNNVEPGDDLREHKLFFKLLLFIGVNVGSKSDRCTKTSNIKWIYFIFVLVFALVNMCIQLFPFFSGEKFENTFWYINFNDHYVVLCILYVVSLREKSINKILYDVSMIIKSNEEHRETVKCSIKRWKYFCIFITFFHTIVEVGYGVHDYLIPAFQNTSNEDVSYAEESFFNINLEGRESLAHIINNVSSFSAIFQVFIDDLFCAFVLFCCVLVLHSYKIVNSKLNSQSQKVISDFIVGHMEVRQMVDEVNKVFSPAILMLVSIQMLQIVASLDELATSLKFEDYVFAFQSVLNFLKSSIEVITIAHLGNQIRDEAQNGVSKLLEASVVNHNQEIGTELNLEVQQMTITYIGQQTTSPVVISASGLFVFDYTLITWVISIAITYLTVISPLKAPSEDKSPCNLLDATECFNLFPSWCNRTEAKLYD